MTRLRRMGFFGVLASFLAGCPIYDGDAGGRQGGGHHHDGTGGDATPSTGCESPYDCFQNETCGSDGQCHPGDCTFWGCVAGYECVIAADQTASCEPASGSGSTGQGGTGGASSGSGGTGGGASSGSGGTGGTGGGDVGGGAGPSPIWCGNPDDCAAGDTCAPDGTCTAGDCTTIGCIFGFVCDAEAQPPGCKPENPAACGADEDCSALGEGFACVSGLCTAPADQCFDQGQCGANSKCVAGKCTAVCDDDGDCPAGYACETGLGICSKAAQPCVITNDCGGPDLVCVDGACVPRSEGGTCPDGSAWVENGCIPDQAASFLCDVEGTQDACAAGSICLHHGCYISCATPNQAACDMLPSFDQCKAVVTASGTYEVCGSSENLGGECDPTAGLACPAGKVCIDGYCK